MQGPAVAYRALFLTGECPCNHNARSSGSSFPHIQQRSKNNHRVFTRETSGREHTIDTSDASACWSVRSSKLHNDTYSGRRLSKSGRNTNQFSKVNFGHTGHGRSQLSFFSSTTIISTIALVVLLASYRIQLSIPAHLTRY